MADDLTRGNIDTSSIINAINIFNTFEKCSGLKLNPSKTVQALGYGSAQIVRKIQILIKESIKYIEEQKTIPEGKNKNISNP